jgi:hypothetical protein
MIKKTMSVLAVSCAVFALGATAGCATVKEGLVGDEYANVLPFAEQTVASMAVERIDFRDTEFIYLRAISKLNSPEIENLQKLLALADEFRDEIIYYSIDLVSVAEMDLPDELRVQEYADALEIMRQRSSAVLDVSDVEFDEIDAEIRSQEDFLAALRAAQPLIDRAGEHFEDMIREIEEQALVDAVTHLDNVIENHYSVFMSYNDVMIQRRDDLLTGLSLIREYRLGNERAMIEFRELSLILNRDLEVPDAPSAKDLDMLEKYLLNQMERDNQVVAYLNVDVDAYFKAHAELDREEAEVIDGLNVARLQIVAWARAHQAMANGAKDPGRWLKIAMDAASAMRRAR